jgi:hypothetical protein
VIHTGGVAAHSWVGLNEVETIQKIGNRAKARPARRPIAWCQRKIPDFILANFRDDIVTEWAEITAYEHADNSVNGHINTGHRKIPT